MKEEDIKIDEDGNIILGELNPLIHEFDGYTIIDVTHLKDGEDMLFVENPKTRKMEIVPVELRCQMCDDDRYYHEILIEGIVVKVCDACRSKHNI